MAFFQFRKRGDDASASSPQPPSAESAQAMRRRARQRLIGAAVLVLAGVIGFPLVFDTQPRPIAIDIPIDIPDRAKVKPLAAPAVPAAVGAVAVAEAEPAPAARPVAQPVAQPVAPAPAATPVPAPAAVVAAPATPKPAAQPAQPKPAEPKAPEPKPAETRSAPDADRAQALLEGKTVPAADGRFVVQVGAFAEAAKASATRQKLERAGLKTYTHVAETRDGKRIRVRVGPFASKAEADKAAAKVKGLDLPAAILTL